MSKSNEPPTLKPAADESRTRDFGQSLNWLYRQDGADAGGFFEENPELDYGDDYDDEGVPFSGAPTTNSTLSRRSNRNLGSRRPSAVRNISPNTGVAGVAGETSSPAVPVTPGGAVPRRRSYDSITFATGTAARSDDPAVRQDSQRFARVELELRPRRNKHKRDASGASSIQPTSVSSASGRPSEDVSLGEEPTVIGGGPTLKDELLLAPGGEDTLDVPPTRPPQIHKKGSKRPLTWKDIPSRITSFIYVPSLPYKIGLPSRDTPRMFLKSLPAIAIVVLVNLLEAVTFGAIVFPKGVNGNTSMVAVGVFVYVLTQMIAQLTFVVTSGLAGGIGTQIVEIIPSLWTIVGGLQAYGDNALKGEELIATVLFAYTLGTLMTGAAFFLLGVFRAGYLVTFFPRHVLVGVIGGIGVFLIKTALEVLARIDGLTFGTLPELFQPEKVMVWGTGLAAAVVLMVLQRFIRWDGLMAVYYLGVIVLFYIVVFATHTPFEVLREEGWLYNLPPIGGIENPFPHYYSLFDFGKVNFHAIGTIVPALFALVFFAVLQVPINIPSINVTLRQDADMNRELAAHGFANMLSSFAGALPSYLTYTTTVVFYRSGGGLTRFSTLVIAMLELGVLFFGNQAASYAPTIIVGAINFQMGLELVKEALYDTWRSVNLLEYLTIVALMLVMVFFDFTIGVAVGLALACVSFVVWHGRKSAIRAVHGGDVARSTVVRLAQQRAVLDADGWRIGVVRLEGALFFGNMGGFEKIAKEISDGFWRPEMLILDFSHVSGVDYSFASMLYKAKRKLMSVNCRIITIVRSKDGIKQFERLGVLDTDPDGPLAGRNFTSLDSALEWCENEILRARYEGEAGTLVSFESSDKAINNTKGTVGRNGTTAASSQTTSSTTTDTPAPAVAVHVRPPSRTATASPAQQLPQPANLLLESLRQVEPDFSEPAALAVASRFRKLVLSPGEKLYGHGDPAESCWLIEEGSLVSTIELDNDRGRLSVSTYLPGSVIGELEFFAHAPRTTTVTALEETIVWALDREKFEELLWHDTLPGTGFMKIALSGSVTREDMHLNRQLNLLT